MWPAVSLLDLYRLVDDLCWQSPFLGGLNLTPDAVWAMTMDEARLHQEVVTERRKTEQKSLNNIYGNAIKALARSLACPWRK